MNKASNIFVAFWNNKPVAIVAVLSFPNGYLKNAFRGSRTVVLPDYQGLGIGSKFSDYIASIYKAQGLRYFVKTVNPALGEYRNKSKMWKPTSKNGILREDIQTKPRGKWLGLRRISYCHEYIGDPAPDILLLSNNKINL